jgi:hypothetical protein
MRHRKDTRRSRREGLRDHVEVRPGAAEVPANCGGPRIELLAEDALVERNGRLLIGSGGVRIDDATVRSLRVAGQR